MVDKNPQKDIEDDLFASPKGRKELFLDKSESKKAKLRKESQDATPTTSTKTKRRQLAELQEMLKTPNNNIGLACLFKKFVLIGEQAQREEVSALPVTNLASAPSWPISSPSCLSKAMQTKRHRKFGRG